MGWLHRSCLRVGWLGLAVVCISAILLDRVFYISNIGYSIYWLVVTWILTSFSVLLVRGNG
jgi:hypothetical protein